MPGEKVWDIIFMIFKCFWSWVKNAFKKGERGDRGLRGKPGRKGEKGERGYDGLDAPSLMLPKSVNRF